MKSQKTSDLPIFEGQKSSLPLFFYLMISARISNRFNVIRSLSLRVVENDAERMTMSRPEAADAVPEIDAIRAASARHGTMMNREHNAITLAQRHNDRPRLHPRPLLRHDEFATGKVMVGLRQ